MLPNCPGTLPPSFATHARLGDKRLSFSKPLVTFLYLGRKGKKKTLPRHGTWRYSNKKHLPV
jgi:hypothetical protein